MKKARMNLKRLRYNLPMKQRIVFFGSGAYTVPIVESLQNHGLQLVITTEAEGTLIDFLKQNGISFHSTHLENPKDSEAIKKFKPTLGVLASYGAFIPRQVIGIFPNGILNIHPSLLPKYKGPSPIQTTILAGEHETGVTIIKLDELVDHGPIVAQEKLKLRGDETTEELKRLLFAKGANMISSIIRMVEQGKKIKFTEQDHSKQTFTQKTTRQDGYIDIENPPNFEVLDRMIRAYYPWPGIWTKWQIADGRWQIVKLLPSQKIQVEGKKPMSYQEFINGYQKEGTELLQRLGIAD